MRLPQIAPMLVTPGALPPSGAEDNWAFEPKLDGSPDT